MFFIFVIFFPLWWGLNNVAAVYHSALRHDIRQVICGTEWVTSQRYQAAVDGFYAAETIGAALPREGLGIRHPEPEYFPQIRRSLALGGCRQDR